MTTRLIRQDERGPYVVDGGERYRPGPLFYPLRAGLRSDADGIVPGAKVRTSPLGSTPIIRLHRDDGEILYWESEGSADAASARGSLPAWDWVDGVNVPRVPKDERQ